MGRHKAGDIVVLIYKEHLLPVQYLPDPYTSRDTEVVIIASSHKEAVEELHRMNECGRWATIRDPRTGVEEEVLMSKIWPSWGLM